MDILELRRQFHLLMLPMSTLMWKVYWAALSKPSSAMRRCWCYPNFVLLLTLVQICLATNSCSTLQKKEFSKFSNPLSILILWCLLAHHFAVTGTFIIAQCVFRVARFSVLCQKLIYRIIKNFTKSVGSRVIMWPRLQLKSLLMVKLCLLVPTSFSMLVR